MLFSDPYGFFIRLSTPPNLDGEDGSMEPRTAEDFLKSRQILRNEHRVLRDSNCTRG